MPNKINRNIGLNYDTLDDVLLDASLKEGMVITTLGEKMINDTKGASYKLHADDGSGRWTGVKLPLVKLIAVKVATKTYDNTFENIENVIVAHTDNIKGLQIDLGKIREELSNTSENLNNLNTLHGYEFQKLSEDIRSYDNKISQSRYEINEGVNNSINQLHSTISDEINESVNKLVEDMSTGKVNKNIFAEYISGLKVMQLINGKKCIMVEAIKDIPIEEEELEDSPSLASEEPKVFDKEIFKTYHDTSDMYYDMVNVPGNKYVKIDISVDKLERPEENPPIDEPVGPEIVKTYSSIEEMEADISSIMEGQYVKIETEDPENEDNGKIFIKRIRELLNPYTPPVSEEPEVPSEEIPEESNEETGGELSEASEETEETPVDEGESSEDENPEITEDPIEDDVPQIEIFRIYSSIDEMNMDLPFIPTGSYVKIESMDPEDINNGKIFIKEIEEYFEEYIEEEEPEPSQTIEVQAYFDTEGSFYVLNNDGTYDHYDQDSVLLESDLPYDQVQILIDNNELTLGMATINVEIITPEPEEPEVPEEIDNTGDIYYRTLSGYEFVVNLSDLSKLPEYVFYDSSPSLEDVITNMDRYPHDVYILLNPYDTSSPIYHSIYYINEVGMLNYIGKYTPPKVVYEYVNVYSSYESMMEDIDNIGVGKYVLIYSGIPTDTNNLSIYVKNEFGSLEFVAKDEEYVPSGSGVEYGDYEIFKVYTNTEAMLADGNNVPVGSYVLLYNYSDTEVSYNNDVYFRKDNGNFIYVGKSTDKPEKEYNSSKVKAVFDEEVGKAIINFPMNEYYWANPLANILIPHTDETRVMDLSINENINIISKFEKEEVPEPGPDIEPEPEPEYWRIYNSFIDMMNDANNIPIGKKVLIKNDFADEDDVYNRAIYQKNENNELLFIDYKEPDPPTEEEVEVYVGVYDPSDFTNEDIYYRYITTEDGTTIVNKYSLFDHSLLEEDVQPIPNPPATVIQVKMVDGVATDGTDNEDNLIAGEENVYYIDSIGEEVTNKIYMWVDEAFVEVASVPDPEPVTVTIIDQLLEQGKIEKTTIMVPIPKEEPEEPEPEPEPEPDPIIIEPTPEVVEFNYKDIETYPDDSITIIVNRDAIYGEDGYTNPKLFMFD